jgi:SAM-dependent methyltransferase
MDGTRPAMTGNGSAWHQPIRSLLGVAYVPGLLERGRARASAEGLTITFKEADAEALPFAGGTFDAVVSTFGVMFTPNQDQAATELMRVCKSGGKIGLANWTPDGFVGQMFKIIGKYTPPPAGVKSPALWGTRGRIAEMFGDAAMSIETEPRCFNLRYRSAEHFVDVFRTFYGPMLKAFAALDEAGQHGGFLRCITVVGITVGTCGGCRERGRKTLPGA